MPSRYRSPPTANRPLSSSRAYDKDLADRIRELISDQTGLTEKQMFGGLAFLVNGNMAVAASSQGGLLVRVDPSESDRLVARFEAEPMEMRGRSMVGWLRVPAKGIKRNVNLRSGW